LGSSFLTTIAPSALLHGCSTEDANPKVSGDDSAAALSDVFGDSASADGPGKDAGEAGVQGIPAEFFGQHFGQLASFPSKIPYGYVRLWDSPSGQWQNIETCDPDGTGGAACFDWTAFDEEMALAKADGVEKALFTMSRTPAWAVTTTADAGGPCDYGGTTCYPPSDIAADGTGTDHIWIGWASALAEHVNAAGYADTHARIDIYEPWNEFYRAPTLTHSGWETTSFQGTFAQLVRLTEDLRCVVKGVGTIHNYPTAGAATPCATLLAALGKTAIDSSALISTPSGEYASAESVYANALQNFLYCNASPTVESGCTTGNAGSEAVDIINLHLYPQLITPDDAFSMWLPAAKSILSTTDLAKPLISGEGSWGLVTRPGSLWDHDGYERAGFIPRYLALGWSAGLSQIFWYAYDNGGWGQLAATYPDGGSVLKIEESSAWKASHDWLLGAVPTASPFCKTTSTVVTCDFLQKGVTPSRLVWDFSFSPADVDGGHGCLFYADPWVCGTGSYTDVVGFSTVQDLSGAAPEAIAGGAVTIGANPVLLQ
jgi:hypothetical protein